MAVWVCDRDRDRVGACPHASLPPVARVHECACSYKRVHTHHRHPHAPGAGEHRHGAVPHAIEHAGYVGATDGEGAQGAVQSGDGVGHLLKRAQDSGAQDMLSHVAVP